MLPAPTSSTENGNVTTGPTVAFDPTDMNGTSTGVVQELRTRLGAGNGLFVATDFDGTLAPISPSPDAPTITPPNKRALELLTDHPLVDVAVVSGRQLSDLMPRIGLSDIVYAGNHGLELYKDGRAFEHTGAARSQPTISAAKHYLERRLSGVPGLRVEDKRLTLTLHFRDAPAEARQLVREAVDKLQRWLGDDVRLVDGKESVEIRPNVDWDKGKAVLDLADELGPGCRTVYVGDDTTDEDVFRVLGRGDVGVRVGSGETAADYRLPEQSAVAPFLRWIATRGVPRGQPGPGEISRDGTTSNPVRGEQGARSSSADSNQPDGTAEETRGRGIQNDRPPGQVRPVRRSRSR